jgi:hypothetical protein
LKRFLRQAQRYLPAAVQIEKSKKQTVTAPLCHDEPVPAASIGDRKPGTQAGFLVLP